MSKVQEERNEYLKVLMEDNFFKGWSGEKKDTFHTSLEFQISYECNLACKYCYVSKHGKKLYPEEVRGNDKVLENTAALLDWMAKNNYQVHEWSIFSGSLFSQQIGFDFLDTLYKKIKEHPHIKPDIIMIPTNLTFILNDEITKKVEDYIEKFTNEDVIFHLSSSVEGKYMEQNRPFHPKLKEGKNAGEHVWLPESKEPRGDEYYDKVFKFLKKHGYGFHPMIYSHDIDKWKRNFLWFQEMFEKYDINYSRIFLLEVRNPEWTDEQIKDFYEFIKFIYKWAYDFLGHEGFFKSIKQGSSLNILKGVIGINSRSGVPCSMQADLQVRMGDLHFGPCHRLSYKGLEFGKFKKEDGKVIGMEAINTEMATAIYSIDHETAPGCMTCPIRKMCNKSCFGANLESTGDPFTVSPKVCQLGFAKVKGAMDGLKELGIFNETMNRITHNTIAASMKYLNKKWEGNDEIF